MRLVATIVAVGFAVVLLFSLGVRSGGPGFVAGFGLLLLGWLLHEHSGDDRGATRPVDDRGPDHDREH